MVRFSMLGAAQPGRAPESASSILAEKALDALALAMLVGVLLLVLPTGRAGEAMEQLLPQVGALLLILLGLLIGGFFLWPYLFPMLP